MPTIIILMMIVAALIALFRVANRGRSYLWKRIPTDYSDDNMQSVDGWQLASHDELCGLAPDALQDLLDQRNPFSDRIAQLLQLSERLDRSSRISHFMRDRVLKLIVHLRVLPLELDALEDSHEAEKLIRQVKLEMDYVVLPRFTKARLSIGERFKSYL